MCDVCYYCGAPATSSEHVPPKALFPEQKDCPVGVDYRKNLIKVPSCEEHNSAKSHDDEYIMYVLAMSLPSNKVGRLLFQTKIMRAIKRNARLIRLLLNGHQRVLLRDIETDTWTESIAMKIDYDRLRNAFTHVAKAIFFHETETIHSGPVAIESPFLLDINNPKTNDKQARLASSVVELMSNESKLGENPDVFYYQIIRDETRCIISMNFFGDTMVYAVLR